jgi:hypothetical protein
MTEQLAPRIDRHVCHVCRSSATVTDEPVIAAKRLDCPQCGMYTISNNFFAYVSADEHWHQVKPLLSLALRWASDHSSPVVLHDGGDVGATIAAFEIALHQAGK